MKVKLILELTFISILLDIELRGGCNEFRPIRTSANICCVFTELNIDKKIQVILLAARKFIVGRVSRAHFFDPKLCKFIHFFMKQENVEEKESSGEEF